MKYKLVPVEPTQEMIDEGRTARTHPRERYKAMLAAAPAVQGVPAIRKLGIMGAAFDPPSVRRAYTYSDQPNVSTAWKLGRAACKERSGGDFIDYGLQLLRHLQDEGFGVFEIDEAAPDVTFIDTAPAATTQKFAFDEDEALSLAERTFSTEIDEQLASDVIQYASRLHNLYAAAPAVQGEPVAYIMGDDVHFEGSGDISDYIRINGQPLYTAPQPASPTSGMNLGQRIQHVGGWETERGTVEFGSVMAVDALVSHVLRDIAVQGDPVACANCQEVQTAEQQPELAKYQPCGCVICTCDHETHCQGCGSNHCGTHPVGQLPAPAYQQSVSDSPILVEALRQYRHNDGSGVVFGYDIETTQRIVARLVEVLESAKNLIANHSGEVLPDNYAGDQIEQIDAALAAHRKGGDA